MEVKSEVINSKFGERLKEIRLNAGKTQIDLAALLGVTKATISRYESNIHSPQVSHVKHLAEFFGVSPFWLSGMSEQKYAEGSGSSKKIPLVGTIAAGQPISAIENIIGYEYIDQNEKVNFCLKIRGTSMIGARIFDGDIVYIREQPDVENGEIAAVIIDGEEATLKRVYKVEGNVILRSENPEFKDMVFSKRDLRDIKILGKAVYFKSEVR